jgi:hypothetical protein
MTGVATRPGLFFLKMMSCVRVPSPPSSVVAFGLRALPPSQGRPRWKDLQGLPLLTDLLAIFASWCTRILCPESP